MLIILIVAKCTQVKIYLLAFYSNWSYGVCESEQTASASPPYRNCPEGDTRLVVESQVTVLVYVYLIPSCSD